MHGSDDSERSRAAREDDRDMNDRQRGPDPRPPGALAFTARTKTVSAYPTAASRFYAFQFTQVTGTETEGGAGTVTALGGTGYAFNLGSAIPPSGTDIIVFDVPYRFVFKYDG